MMTMIALLFLTGCANKIIYGRATILTVMDEYRQSLVLPHEHDHIETLRQAEDALDRYNALCKSLKGVCE
jgi:hypothetical protein